MRLNNYQTVEHVLKMSITEHCKHITAGFVEYIGNLLHCLAKSEGLLL